MRAQRIIGFDGIGDEIGALRFDAWIDMLASAAGAPPPGVSLIARREQPSA